MRIPLFILPSILLLSACSQEKGNDQPSEPAELQASVTPGSVMLGDVDLRQPLRILGTEPFWSIEITPDRMVYSAIDSDEQRAANPGPSIEGTTAIYRTQTDRGVGMDVTLVAGNCSDGMSDRVYPIKASVVLGDVTLTGCAASQEFLQTAPAP